MNKTKNVSPHVLGHAYMLREQAEEDFRRGLGGGIPHGPVTWINQAEGCKTRRSKRSHTPQNSADWAQNLIATLQSRY